MGTKKVFLSLWFLLSYTSYCAALQIDDTAYLDIHTSTLNNVTKPVLSSDEASFKHLIKQFSAMQSENRHLLERVGRIESENRQLFERLNDGESENKELLERVAGLESDNRQLLERQYRLESASSLYKKEIQWLKTEVMIQREHTHSMETIIKNQQAEIDELKQIAHISDESSNVPFSTGSQDIMSNEDLQPPLVLQENVKPRIRRTTVDFQVAFLATLSNDQTRIGHLQNVVFDHVETNIGNYYDPNVGLFRAPKAGTYVFSTTLMTYNNHSSHYGFFVNRRDVTHMWVNGQHNNYDTTSQTVVLHLNKGDDVTVKHTDADKNLRGYHYCIFSGFLLYQDRQADPAIIGK